MQENNLLELDKDLLYKNNKIYSPETCCFIPKDINMAFVKANKVRGIFPIGVSSKGEKFSAQISKYSKQIKLGTFNTIEDAFNSYKISKEEYLKELANKFSNVLNKSIINTLLNYSVEITD